MFGLLNSFTAVISRQEDILYHRTFGARDMSEVLSSLRGDVLKLAFGTGKANPQQVRELDVALNALGTSESGEIRIFGLDVWVNEN